MDDESQTEEYQRRRDEFVAKVFRFHEHRGTPLKRLPMLGGRELNIYHLYEEVQKRGGSEKVTKVRMWGEIARTFNLPPTVTSASYAIRNHFIKLLEQYEAKENGDLYGYDSSTPSPSLPSLPSLPLLTSLPAFPSLPKPLPLLKKMTLYTPTTQTVTSETDLGLSKLMRSLLSGLPNEVDFAFNVLLILSHSNALPILQAPSFLDTMLAHVAIFSEDDPGLEAMYNEAWYPYHELDFIAFWETVVPEWVYAVIINTPFKKSLYECLLFNTGSLLLRGEAISVGEEGVEGARVAQVATILSNLSGDEASARMLAGHSGVLRFLVLAMTCYLPSVLVPGLDCLSSLASHLLLDCDTDSVDSPAHLLTSALHQCILSQDRYAVKRGVEILGKLAWSVSNSAPLLSTPQDVFDRILNVLLVPDCEMTMIALDCLYNLSLFGREVAERVAQMSGLVEILVWFLFFKVESLSSKSLGRIKLYFIGDSSSLAQYLVEIQAKAAAPAGVRSPPTVVGSGVTTRGVIVGGKITGGSPLAVTNQRSAVSRANSPLATNQIAAVSRSVASTSTQQRVGQALSSVVTTRLLAVSQVKGGEKSIGSNSREQLSGLHSILRQNPDTGGSKLSIKEEQASHWLKQNYEVHLSTQHLVPLVDIYAQYVLYCSSQGKNDFLNNAEFIKVLRQGYPGSELREVKTVGRKVIHFLTGLRHIPARKKTTLPLTNHTPSTETPGSTPLTIPSTTGSTPSRTMPTTVDCTPSTMSGSTPLTTAAMTGTAPLTTHTQSGPIFNKVMESSAADISRLLSSLVTVRASLQGAKSLVQQSSSVGTKLVSFGQHSSSVGQHSSSASTELAPLGQQSSSLTSHQLVATSNPPSLSSSSSSSSSSSNASVSTSRDSTPQVKVFPENNRDSLTPKPVQTGSPRSDNPAELASFNSNKSSPDASDVTGKSESSLSNCIPVKNREKSPVKESSISFLSSSPSPLSSASGLSRATTPDPHRAAATSRVDAGIPTSVAAHVSTASTHVSTASTHVSTASTHISTASTVVLQRVQPVATLETLGYSRDSRNVQTGGASIERANGARASPERANGSTPKRPAGQNSILPRANLLSNLEVSTKEGVTGRGVRREGSVDSRSAGTPPQQKVRVVENSTCDSPVNIGKRDLSQRSTSVEPVLLASAVSSAASAVDQNRQMRSLTPNPHPVGEGIPEAKRIRLTMTTTQSSKQQQIHVAQQQQPQSCEEAMDTRSGQETVPKLPQQTSYLTSSIQFLNSRSPIVSAVDSNLAANTSNKSQTGSNSSSIRPVCLWENCMSMRYSWKDLLHHTVTCHISPLPPHTPSLCHWAGCGAGPERMKPSLIRHVETHHCNPGPKPVPPSVTATLARLKHCPPLEVEVESPLTKAVRVTAALVLRNLCREVPSVRTVVKRHEGRLCEVALSGSEASNTVSECLYYLHHPSPAPTDTPADIPPH